MSGDPIPRGATLRSVALEVGGAHVVGDESVYVTDVRHASRAVEPGDLFVVRRGARHDGVRFVEYARLSV